MNLDDLNASVVQTLMGETVRYRQPNISRHYHTAPGNHYICQREPVTSSIKGDSLFMEHPA